jgi:hypothetical protein
MNHPVSLAFGLLAVAGLVTLPQGAMARASPTPPPISLTYRGGPLLPHVRVVTLFWGSYWSSSTLPAYFNNFFRALFADGRYMANLAQYSASGRPIGNGAFAGTATDTQTPPTRLQDAQIRTEIRAQIAAGHLPKPDANTVYAVFTPPSVEVFDEYGANSVDDFYSYHDFDFAADGFPYLVLTYDDSLGDARTSMTVDASHELSEAVTDPEVTGADNQVGWYDDNYGEVTDIVDTLYDEGKIGDSGYIDELDASDGTAYLVEKNWSAKDNAPVAFAP